MKVLAKDVATVRAICGLGILECRAALIETSGDIQMALALLRARGGHVTYRMPSLHGRMMTKVEPNRRKAAIIEVDFAGEVEVNIDSRLDAIAGEILGQTPGRAQRTDAICNLIDKLDAYGKFPSFVRGEVLGSGGKVGAYHQSNGKAAAIIELSTDVPDEVFTQLCEHLLAIHPSPIVVDESDLSETMIERLRDVTLVNALNRGIAGEAAQEMVKEAIHQRCLMLQPFIKDGRRKIRDLLPPGVVVTGFVLYNSGGN